MSLPKVLKNLDLFDNGESFRGQVAEVTLPVLARTFEQYRGAGMDGPVPVDLGQEPLEMEWKCGGYMRQVVRQFGATTVGAVMLRFAGAYQNDETGAVDAVEIIVRGRHQEIDRGTAKPGEATEFGVKTACSYYKEIVNGETEVEIDLLNMVFIVAGVDLLAQQRQALGRDGSSLSGLVAPPRLNIPRTGGLAGLV